MTGGQKAQLAHALITKYVKLYTEKHGEPPLINRNRDKWGFSDMVEDLGKADAHKVVEYYFGLRKPAHTLAELFRTYDELHKQRLADEEDKRRVAQLHKETAERVKKWKEQHGERGTDSPSSGV